MWWLPVIITCYYELCLVEIAYWSSLGPVRVAFSTTVVAATASLVITSSSIQAIFASVLLQDARRER